MVDSSQRGYRWGRFHGWSAFILGVLLLMEGFQNSGLLRWILCLSAAVYIIAGTGIYGKKRYGFVLLYVLVARSLLQFFLMGSARDRSDYLIPCLLFAWWSIPAIFYYPKRYREFGFGRKPEAAEPSL